MELSPDALLLSTKLKIPVPRRDYVIRKSLFDRLSQCGEMGVVFVSGGAGTGKTTLLSSFIREKGLKNVGWVSLDSSNANVYSFWLYFTAAVNSFLGDDDDFLTLMRSNLDTSHMKSLLTVLVNRLCGLGDCYLVLDDVQVIRDKALIRSFEYFLNAMPENFHLFMLSREDPPVYLGELAVAGRLLFLDGGQMRLSPAEGIAFLRRTLRFRGSDEEAKRLTGYAEGWIGGLQLAAAAAAAGRPPDNLFRAGGGIAAEYLTREIVESLTEDERDFLTGTGFLAYFDAGICAGIFDGFSKSRFDAMIETLTEKDLFIVCIDEQNGVYRYHNILSDYLTQQFSALPEERRKALRSKAAAAFERRGDCEEAMRQFCAGGDYENVMRTALSMKGRMEAWSYLDQVPDDRIIQNADLTAQCFLYNFENFNMERCRVLFEKFREHYGDSDLFRVMRSAETYVTRSSDILPEYCVLTAKQIDALNLSPATKAMTLVENSMALLEFAQYEEAESCVNDATRICAGTNAFVDFFAYNQKAQIFEEVGRLNDSLACYEKSKERIRSPWMTAGVGANYYFGLAGIYLRRMETDRAAETLESAKRLLDKQHIRSDVTDMTLAYHLAEIKFLCGDDAGGAAYVEGILSEYPSFNVLTLVRLIYELDCAGLLPKKLAEQYLSELDKNENYRLQPCNRLVRARILFDRGETAQAVKEAEDLLAFSRSHKNRLRLVQAGLLEIRILLGTPETPERQRKINNLLREAVYYACGNRILMPFFLDRAVLLPLLRGLAAQSPGKDAPSARETEFIRDAAALCGGSPAPKKQEILSARETEVLGELAKGITNREIADRLCISQATVKTHVLSIFGKLSVSSRLAAVERGRKMGLIP